MRFNLDRAVCTVYLLALGRVVGRSLICLTEGVALRAGCAATAQIVVTLADASVVGLLDPYVALIAGEVWLNLCHWSDQVSTLTRNFEYLTGSYLLLDGVLAKSLQVLFQ